MNRVELTIALASAAFMLGAPASSFAETQGRSFYVAAQDSRSSDSNSGTQTSPFKTIQKAANIVLPGDTVYIRTGTYLESVSIQRSGTAAARIVFKAFGDGPVLIDGEYKRGVGIAVGTSGQERGSFVTVEGIEITRIENSTGNSAGAIARSNQGVIFSKLRIHDCKPPGVRIAGLAKGNIVEYCIINDNCAGIVVRNTSNEGRPQGTIVRWNHVFHNTVPINGTVEGADQIGNTGSDDTTIEHNLVHHAGDDCIDSVDSLRTTIRDNILYLADWVQDPNGDGNGVKLGVGGGGHHLAHHNVCFLNANTGIQVNNTAGLSYASAVYGNTLYGNGTKGFTTSANSFASVFNNLCAANGLDFKYEVQTMGYSDYNYAGVGSFYKSASPHNIAAPVDPELTGVDALHVDINHDGTPDVLDVFNDPNAFPDAMSAVQSAEQAVKQIFSLKPGSPCIDAGIPVPEISDNFSGSSPDIGAFESESGAMRGDMNCDSAVNGNDIEPFVLALMNPKRYAKLFPGCDRNRADMNGDGYVDGFDITLFVEMLN